MNANELFYVVFLPVITIINFCLFGAFYFLVENEPKAGVIKKIEDFILFLSKKLFFIVGVTFKFLLGIGFIVLCFILIIKFLNCDTIIDKLAPCNPTDSAQYVYNVVNAVSGIVTPFFTFIALFVAYKTFIEDRIDNKKSLQQHKNDQFTNDFFNMLQIQKTLRNELKGSFSVRYTIKENATGVSYFSVAKKELKNIFDVLEGENIKSEDLKYNITREYNLNAVLEEYNDGNQEEKIKISYGAFLEKHPELNSYFRHLYHILKRLNIEEKTCRGPENQKKNEIKQYSDILQATLTEDELVFVNYNCFCFENTRKLVLQFNFLSNLSEEKLLNKDHCLRKKFREL